VEPARQHLQPITAPSHAELYGAALRELKAALGSSWHVDDHHDAQLSWSHFIAADHSLPAQGWKLHISAAASDAHRLCRRVLPRLVERYTSFKLPTSLEGIIQINSGAAGESQIGKIVTAYPASEDLAASIARELDLLWPDTEGPPVASELSVRRGGAVYLRYGAFGGGPRVTTHNGLAHALVRPDGIYEPDDRSRPFPEWIPHPPLTCVHPDTENFLQEVGSSHRRFLPVALLHSSPKGKVFYGMATDDATEVTIKMAGTRTCEDLRGFNAGKKAAREFTILSELQRRAPGIAPRPLDLFQTGQSVLVATLIEGTAVEDLPQPEQVGALPRLAATVATLHQAGYAHRDLKLCHALVTDERVSLIDFELSAPIGAASAPLGGTHGYIPPEGDAATVAPSSDVYALGACVAHVILGCDPASLPQGAGRLVGLLRLKGATEASRMVGTLTQSDPRRRPSAHEAAEMLMANRDLLADEITWKPKRNLSRVNRHARRSAIEAAFATREYSFTDSNGRGWRNTHAESSFDSEGINLGAAGVLIGLMSVGEALGVRDFDQEVLEGATKLAADEAPIGSCGLFTGSAGVALALAVSGSRLGRARLIDRARERLRAAVSNCRDLDLFSGAAGIVWAGCVMSDLLAATWPLDLVRPLADRLLDAASCDRGFPSWPGTAAAWNAGDVLTGAAHGASGIAMALGVWGQRCSDPNAVAVALDAFRGLYANGRTPGGEGLRMTLGGEPTQPGVWCHGATGYLWCILQSFGDRPELRHAIDWAVQSLLTAPPIADTTYCHGVSGQLETWRTLHSIDRYRAVAAERVALLTAVLLTLRQRRNGLTVWSSEDPTVTTPDLWVGFLAPATAIAVSLSGFDAAVISSSWLRLVATPRSTACA
jgi:hypothetical protein